MRSECAKQGPRAPDVSANNPDDEEDGQTDVQPESHAQNVFVQNRELGGTPSHCNEGEKKMVQTEYEKPFMERLFNYCQKQHNAQRLKLMTYIRETDLMPEQRKEIVK